MRAGGSRHRSSGTPRGEKQSNSTGELCAAIELLYALTHDAARPIESRGVIRPDSELVMGAMTGRTVAHENVELTRRVRGLWEELRKRHGGQVTLSHVRGHSHHKWNDRADALAEKGRQGEIKSRRAEWEATRAWLDQPLLVSTQGRFTLAASRTFWVRRGATHVEIGMDVTIDVPSMRWTRDNRPSKQPFNKESFFPFAPKLSFKSSFMLGFGQLVVAPFFQAQHGRAKSSPSQSLVGSQPITLSLPCG